MLNDFRPMQLLLSLWPTADFEMPADLAAFGRSIAEQFREFKQVQVMQAPEGAQVPPEMARLVLLAEPRTWVLELAPGRVNLHRLGDQQKPQENTLDGLSNDLHGMIAPLHAWLAEKTNLRVYRAGLITELFCGTRSSASEKITNYFLQPRAVQGLTPNEVHLALHNRVVIEGGLMVNRWMRIQPLRSRDANRVDFAAHVQVDINTMAEDTQVKTSRDLAAFLDAATAHIESGIPLLGDPDFLA